MSSSSYKKVKKLLIPTAGIGARLAPITSVIHKSMLQVLCKPIIHYGIIEGLQAGIEEFIFIISDEHAQYLIERYIASAMSTMIHHKRITFVEQKYTIGLGHAILSAREQVQNERFAVLLPDEIFVDTESGSLLASIFNTPGLEDCNIAAVSNVEIADVHKYGIVYEQHTETEGPNYRISHMFEKPDPTHVTSVTAMMGRYVLQPMIFEYLQYAVDEYVHDTSIGIDRDEVDLTSSMHKMLIDGAEFRTFHGQGTRLDCGSVLGLLEANIILGLYDNSLRTEIQKMLENIGKRESIRAISIQSNH